MEHENSDPCFEPDESNAHSKHYVHKKYHLKYLFVSVTLWTFWSERQINSNCSIRRIWSVS